MGVQVTLLNLLHLTATFIAVILILSSYFSNNWVQGKFIKNDDGVIYTSGIFLGCFTLTNLSTICSRKVIYGGPATFNYQYKIHPKEFIRILSDINVNLISEQLVNDNEFTPDVTYLNEGTMTFADTYYTQNANDGKGIFCIRLIIPIGIVAIIIATISNSILSGVYSTSATIYFMALYILGSILITIGSTIVFIGFATDAIETNSEIQVSFGLGLVLNGIGILFLLILSILLSVTLITNRKAKIKSIQKTNTLIANATMMTLGQNPTTLGQNILTLGQNPMMMGQNLSLGPNMIPMTKGQQPLNARELGIPAIR